MTRARDGTGARAMPVVKFKRSNPWTLLQQSRQMAQHATDSKYPPPSSDGRHIEPRPRPGPIGRGRLPGPGRGSDRLS